MNPRFKIQSLLLLFMTVAFAAVAAPPKREFYEIKIYHLKDADQVTRVENYLKDAYIPAMHRAGIKNVGVFKPVASDTMAGKLIYVFTPLKSLEQLLDMPKTLAKDAITLHFSESFYKPLSDEQAQLLFDFIQNYQERIGLNTISTQARLDIMQKSNPRIILRNYLLHQAIEKLEIGDASLFEKLQLAMKEPYSKNHDELFAKRPDWATQKAGCSMLSCSS